MMRQYRGLKAQHPGTILFFRLGDFYEMFEQDAVEVSQLLGLTLTQRGGVPMCGVPYHSAENYLKKLLRAGRKVAICEQFPESAGNRGLFERRITEILTPGTLTDDVFLEPRESSYVACFHPEGHSWHMALWEVSIGQLFAGTTEDGGDYPELQRILARFNPKEILLPEGTLQARPDVGEILRGCRVEEVPHSWYRAELGPEERHLEVLISDFQTQPELHPCLRAVGRYLDRLMGANPLPVHRAYQLYERDRITVDSSTLRNLELLSNAQGEAEGSLLEVLDETLTPGGARLLRQELCAPEALPERIRRRLGFTDWFVRHPERLAEIRGRMRGLGDLERILTRLELDRASPYDLLSLGETLVGALDCACLLEEILPLPVEERSLRDIASNLRRAIHPEAPRNLDQGPRINDGHDADLDRWRALAARGEEYLEELRRQEAAETGLPLKLKYNRVFGYFYELTRLQAANVPPGFLRRQSLANAERFTTAKLLAAEADLVQSRERAEDLDRQLFLELREGLKPGMTELRRVAEWLKTVDYHQALAQAAVRNGWNPPVIREEAVLRIVNGRHPVVERYLPPGAFVPNDLELTPDSFFRLVTGPNMAGKSTYLRQTALIVLLAHLGSYVPADAAEVGVVDRVFCRVGAHDRLTRGDSTFLVEMKETAFILRNATSRSLVIMDEIGRGTSTQDGLALAWAVSEYLMNVIRPRTLFSTHYHELTDLAHPALENLHMEVLEREGEVVFLRRARSGPARSSYGIYAAKLAGVPEVVLQRARDLINRGLPQGQESSPYRITELFSPLELIGSEVVSLDLDTLTPKEALDLLYRIQSEFKGTKRR